MKKPYKISSIFFLILSILFIVGSILTFKSIPNYISSKEENNYVVALVSDVHTFKGTIGVKVSKVYVDYTYKGKEYERVYLGQFKESADYKEGKLVNCLLDKNNPTKIYKETNIFSFIMRGIFFLCFGLIFLKLFKKR